MNTVSPLLSVRGLTRHLPSRGGVLTVFEGVTFDVHQGEIVCLLGPSGCGKTTLLQTIAGLQPASKGLVCFAGSTLTAPHPEIGLVFQDANLLPWFTVWQNVSLGLRLRSGRRTGVDVPSAVNRALQSVGLDGFARLYPHQLSGGMAQRVALARALVRQPRLLLMDEPFAALDAFTRRHLQSLLVKLVRERQTAVLLVTHDIDEALFVGDRVLLMTARPGRIEREWRIQAPHPRWQQNEQMLSLHAYILEHLSQHSWVNEEEVVTWVI